jgi:hypothetical protein
MATNEDDAIAEFIRSKGVTRCPTAFTSPTSASANDADRLRLQQHAEVIEVQRLKRMKKLGLRVACGEEARSPKLRGQ